MKRIFLSAFLVACSGADASQLLTDSGMTPLVDAGSGVDAAQPQPDGAAPVDAAADVVSIDDASAKDAAPDVHVGPPDSKIRCGPYFSCSAQSQVCCWHSTSTTKPYECVADVSACAAIDDVPMACSSQDNCASQGNPSFTCCATGGGYGSGTCAGADIATVVACKSDCNGLDDYAVGCSVTLQNCADTTQSCINSKCTDPGATICY